MGKCKLYVCLLSILAGWSSCAVNSPRKSTAYYEKNKVAIHELVDYYNNLYQHQPFSVGFTDKSFEYYLMEVTTDTLRYIYNTEKSEEKLFETIGRFKYDTSQLKKLAAKMKEIKCLWLDKTFFYLDEKKEIVTFLSFKSVAVDKPFVENKYYVLVFLEHKLDHPAIKARIKKGELVRVNDLVYFMIGNRFR
jgi:hypothetical protein